MTPMPTFAAFYEAVNRRPPFPWQARLARQVADTEKWPREIGVPTGLGKTACLEVAVWWLASQADRAPEQRTAPTRIWWVVNRRLLVDSTSSHARTLADALAANDRAGLDGTLACVADRLRSLSADRDACPLDVISLRGGITSRTPVDPSRPTVVLCTLPMYGSRLLFRGYGSGLRAVDAAMAGTDSLVLVDEAHLAPHLRSLLDALGECAPATRSFLGTRRSAARVVALTATGEADEVDRFDLTEDDERNAVVRMRLDAAKPVSLRIHAKGDVDKHLADATTDLMQSAPSPASFVVFTNTPRTARDVSGRLRAATARSQLPTDVLLLTGRTREREAERIRARILDRDFGMAASRTAASRERHLVVVATQTLEVGADIDAEYMVTEACGVRALTQRLGRLNRLGRHAHARAVYVHTPPPKRRNTPQRAQVEWPVYGEEPHTVLTRLQEAAAARDGEIDLSPRRVGEVLGTPGDDPGRAPEILPGLLWEWIKTTTPPEGEAPVEPYFNGIAAPNYAVTVIWRAHVPEPGERVWPRTMDREAVDVPLAEIREALADDGSVHRLASDTATVEAVAPAELRPGDQVLLPTDRGMLDDFGWDPDATAPVVDVSLPSRGLPVHETAIGRLAGIAAGDLVRRIVGNDDQEVDDGDRGEAVAELLEAIRDAAQPFGWSASEWQDFVASLAPRVIEARREVPRIPAHRPAAEPRIGEFDETSLGATVELEAHGRAVGVRARVVADRIGVPTDLRDVVELAGTLHDIGKADPRFQRWLDPEGRASRLMAKSSAPRHRWESMRAQAGWPRGGRHEDLSARLVRAWLEHEPGWGTPILRDLLVHLVVSHHGKGRPLVPPARDDTGRTVSSSIAGTRYEVAADLSEIDWAQPARFRRLNDHLGPWGLALLESIVIRSDHAVSARGDVELVTR